MQLKLVDGLQKQTNAPLSIKEITSLSFNIRCPGEITVYHDDKVSKIDRDGTVSGKKIKTSSYNWISGTYAGSLDMAEFEQEWFAKSGTWQTVYHGEKTKLYRIQGHTSQRYSETLISVDGSQTGCFLPISVLM